MPTKSNKVKKADIRHGITLWQPVNDHFGRRVIRTFATSIVQSHGEFDGEYFTALAYRHPKCKPFVVWLRLIEGHDMFTTKKAAERALRLKFTMKDQND